MTAKRNTLLLLIAATVALLTAACDNGGDCNISNVSYNRIFFYTTDGNDDTEATLSYPGTLTVSLVINGNDSIVVNHLAEASELALPMCYTQECDTLVFRFEEQNATDSLFVEHTNIPYFISMDCGTTMYHKLTGVRHTDNFIDSVAIVEPMINFDVNENIKLYFID